MKSESRLGSSFRSFISSGGIAPKAALVLLIGVLLLAIGSFDFGGKKDICEEEKLSEICSMTEGVGECRVVVTYAEDGESVYAVALICDGADSPSVRKRLTETVCTLYGIGANRVAVIKLSE